MSLFKESSISDGTLKRRDLLPLMGALMTAACSPVLSTEPQIALTPEQRHYQEGVVRMRQKFGGLGAELIVDAMDDGAKYMGINFYREGTFIQFYGAGSHQGRGRSTQSMPGTIPERARIVWRGSAEWGKDAQQNSVYAGKIIGDEIIEVGTRIPQALLDDLKRDPKGGLRLKFRMSQQGTLLGWDIDRRPGYVPGSDIHVRAVYSHVGGDFKEARPANVVFENGKPKKLPESLPTPLSADDDALLKQYDLMLVQGEIRTIPPTPTNHRRVWEKGWYIDKQKREKISIDF